jgi:hypothetical protein
VVDVYRLNNQPNENVPGYENGKPILGPGGIRNDAFMDPNSVTEREEVVVFNEDATVERTEEDCRYDTRFLYGGTDGLTNSNLDFLSRPVIVGQFPWTGAQIENAELSLTLYPQALLADQMIKEKIAGFRYFRGNLVLRLQVNAQPFNAGRLIMGFIPFYNSMTVIPSNIKNLNGFTGLRTAELDVGSVTSCELRVPYMSPLAYTDLVTGFGEMGAVSVRVYSKLTGGVDVECTLWAHFENPQLEMPTGEPLHTFTSSLQVSKRVYAQSGDTFNGIIEHIKKAATSGEKTFKGSKQEAKNKEKGKGDWENLFNAQQRVLDKFGDIPVIGEASKVVSWFANIGEGLAGMFGYSRPTNPVFPSPMAIRYHRNYTNFNGDTLSKPLALDARNEIIRPDNMFGTSEDEMSLAKILSKPIFMTQFDISATQAPGTILWHWPVNPNSCYTELISGLKFKRFNTFLSYLSNLFDMWRGGIVYRFKFVKSPFQTGRIRFVFVPGATTDTDLTTVAVEKCYSQVVDLRMTSEIDFTIPFVSNRLWNDLRGGTLDPIKFTNSEPTGILFAEVLNTLKVAGQAADHINTLVETFGATDFQFAYPNREGRASLFDAVPPAERIVAQSNFFPSNDVKAFDANVASTGEAVVSVRQLLSKYVRMGLTKTPSPVGGGSVVIDPTATSLYVAELNDFYSWISCMYSMYSGSMRLLLFPDIGSLDNAVDVQTITLNKWTTGSRPPTYALLSSTSNREAQGVATVKWFPGLEQSVEVDIPWYQPVPAMPTQIGLPNIYAFDSSSAGKIPQNIPSTIRVYEGEYSVARSIGEDFTFGYLLGPPLTIFENFAPAPLLAQINIEEDLSHYGDDCVIEYLGDEDPRVDRVMKMITPSVNNTIQQYLQNLNTSVLASVRSAVIQYFTNNQTSDIVEEI